MFSLKAIQNAKIDSWTFVRSSRLLERLVHKIKIRIIFMSKKVNEKRAENLNFDKFSYI